jgi:putative Mg2+ transporter-C (MgtC) family protein
MPPRLLYETQIPLEDIAIRLLAATVLGLLVGIDREWRSKPAGMRTHALVALGSASFVILALELVAGPLRHAEDVALDPTRVIEGIIGGIGFLGAGSIIQGRDGVKGLTTGASIWTVGAIGVACASGFVIVGAIVAGFTLVVLVGLGEAQRLWNPIDDKDGAKPKSG